VSSPFSGTARRAGYTEKLQGNSELFFTSRHSQREIRSAKPLTPELSSVKANSINLAVSGD
jgi:hypothetical protein